MKYYALFCGIIWSFSVCYSLYRFVISTKDIAHLLNPDDFDQGWIVSRKRDVSDFEWSVLKNTIASYYHLIIGHILLSQIVWNFAPKLTNVMFIIYGSWIILKILSPLALLIVWINILIVFLTTSLGKRSLCYAFLVVSLVILHKEPFNLAKYYVFEKDSYQMFLMKVSLAWLNAKCLSFAIDSINDSSLKPFNLNSTLTIFAYCLYFPTFLSGPIYNYSNFAENLANRSKYSLSSFFLLLASLLRYVFWILVFELFLHYIYSSSIQFYPDLCNYFDAWSLSGFGYALSCLFHLKYFIIYGSVGSIAKLDGIILPPPPKCVTRIHLSTHLWRYFDSGLYLWLKKYFYKPLIANNYNIERKLFASSVCFSCVCIWHGMDKAVVFWCLINFLCVSFESLSLSSQKFFKKKLKLNLSCSSEKHLRAAVSSFFFFFMIISNIFFLSNYEIGVYFIKRILFSFSLPFIYTLMIFYTACYFSIHLTDLEYDK